MTIRRMRSQLPILRGMLLTDAVVVEFMLIKDINKIIVQL
jgi:hypothetical protein